MGRVVLVLGAGASVGAVNSEGAAIPKGDELARMLSDRFLGGEHADAPLSIVAELAISESDLFTVQEYIRTIFEDFQPAGFHELLPTFKWAGLATTNYDLVIERAYDQCENSAQDPVPLIKNGDRIESMLRTNRSIMLLKLHGCITRTSDTQVPLILSVDQYLTHRSGRDRVFDHLKNLSYEQPLVFIGHSLQDPDIRQMLIELGESDQRPRFYTVTPQVTGPEQRFWERKRITTIIGTFDEFLTTVNSEIDSPFRGIVGAPSTTDIPIAERFVVHNPGLSPDCLDFLENQVDYIRTGMPIEDLAPHLFYRGFSPRWAAIDKSLDVRRDIEDPILMDAILDEEEGDDCRLYIIKGHAGSGKSVLLQRVAWEASLTFQKLCLYLQQNGQISFEAIRELSKVINERIYLFVDDIDEHVFETLDVIDESRRFSIPLTIIGASRINEWNMSCEDIEPHVVDDFELPYLSAREIDSLLGLLEKHKSLFRLEEASPSERKAAFVERAERQLLVALHEATLGKPFEDIIADEFAAIEPREARLIYLGICFLNRFDVYVRAGIISRVYGVRFTEFKSRFFAPLEGLVFTQEGRRLPDIVYVTRHPHIAEIVVSRALTRPDEKLDMYLKMVNSLNVDYDSDWRAFRRLVRGRSILAEFPDHQHAQRVYNAARFKVRDDSHLFHQMAIYEMNRPNGNLDDAYEHLSQAKRIAPHRRAITHSLAELQLRRAENSRTELEFNKYLLGAERIAGTLIGPSAIVSHGYHTLSKARLAKLNKLLASGENDGPSDLSISEAVKDVEDIIQQGLQQFPDDPYLLTSESDLANLLSDNDRSVRALKIAFDNNDQDPFIAVRLAKLLSRTNAIEEALEVYKSSLASGSADKRIHFNYAKLMIDQGLGNDTDIEYHLRRSFTDGDANTEAQFWHARQQYVNDRIDEAQTRFRRLRYARVNPVVKRKIRGVLAGDGQIKRFTGRVERRFSDYGFVLRDGTADLLYLNVNNVDSAVWENLGRNTRVSFAIGFNFWGAAAIDIQFESLSAFSKNKGTF